jgi:hypothetical protein
MKSAVLALALAACGPDEVDLTGLYRVDADVSSTNSCNNDQPVANPPIALKFSQGNLFGSEYFYYDECGDLAGASCSGSGLFGTSFAEPIEGGWRGTVTASGGTAPNCVISYTEQTALLHGTVMIVEISTYSEDVTTAAECAPEEADKRGKNMPCTAHERIEATKL